jgi:hypothetical protein
MGLTHGNGNRQYEKTLPPVKVGQRDPRVIARLVQPGWSNA